MLLKSDRLPVPPIELKKLRRSVIYFAGLNLVLGLSINAGSNYMGGGLNIDNFARMGGFCFRPALRRPDDSPPWFASRDYSTCACALPSACVVGVLVLFSFYLSQLPG